MRFFQKFDILSSQTSIWQVWRVSNVLWKKCIFITKYWIKRSNTTHHNDGDLWLHHGIHIGDNSSRLFRLNGEELYLFVIMFVSLMFGIILYLKCFLEFQKCNDILSVAHPTRWVIIRLKYMYHYFLSLFNLSWRCF